MRVTSSNDDKPRGVAKPDVVSWLMVAAAAVIVGAVAVWLYIRLVHVEPEPPKPIRIFRSPTNKDYSSIAALSMRA